MPALNWNDGLELQHAEIDATHREFVDLLARVEQSLAGATQAVVQAMEAFTRHVEAHFGQEDAWLQRIGFASDSCHAEQHAQVLELVREVRRRLVEQDDVAMVAKLVPALAEWFPMHAQTMDAGLALAMRETGFDVHTGQMARPPQPASEATAPGC